jgi:hypothetical protein
MKAKIKSNLDRLLNINVGAVSFPDMMYNELVGKTFDITITNHPDSARYGNYYRTNRQPNIESYSALPYWTLHESWIDIIDDDPVLTVESGLGFNLFQ